MAETEQLPVQQAREGDPAAWDALFRRFQLPLYVYVFELVHHEQTSLDIVQETFIAAVRHVTGLRDDEKFASWLFGIAHQKCLLHWRKKGGKELLLDEIPDAPDESIDAPDDFLIRREQEAEFMNALNELPPPIGPSCSCILSKDFRWKRLPVQLKHKSGPSSPACITPKNHCANYWRPRVKTPREILLSRHKAVEPKLDHIRQNVIGKLNNKGTKTQSFPDRVFSLLLRFPQAIWRELFWPSRRIWTGLAAVWLLILAANFSMRDNAETRIATPPPSREMIMAFRQEQQLMNELIGPNDPPVAEAQKPPLPNPASERRTELLTS